MHERSSRQCKTRATVSCIASGQDDREVALPIAPRLRRTDRPELEGLVGVSPVYGPDTALRAGDTDAPQCTSDVHDSQADVGEPAPLSGYQQRLARVGGDVFALLPTPGSDEAF